MKHKLTSFIIICFGLVATVAAQPGFPNTPAQATHRWLGTSSCGRRGLSNKKAEG